MKDIRMNPKIVDTIDFGTNELLNCKIYVYSDEYTTPHFHIISDNKEIGECCICIYESLYFDHKNKQIQLNSKQRKILNNWLRSPSKIAPEISSWGLICAFWEGGNGKEHIPTNPVQPDYSNLENMRD